MARPCCPVARVLRRDRVTFAFIALPVVAIFIHVPPATLLHQLSNPIVTDALIVSLKTIVVAQVVILAVRDADRLLPRVAALPRAARSRSRSSSCRSSCRRPWPAIGLLVAFGRVGLLGSTFDFLGINVAFNQAAVVLAITLVAGPFYVRQAIAVVRGGRREPDRRLAHARRGAAADVLPGDAAARERGARRRRGDLPRARARRVRRHDHVRRQPAGADADPAARRLLRRSSCRTASTSRSRSARCS